MPNEQKESKIIETEVRWRILSIRRFRRFFFTNGPSLSFLILFFTIAVLMFVSEPLREGIKKWLFTHPVPSIWSICNFFFTVFCVTKIEQILEYKHERLRRLELRLKEIEKVIQDPDISYENKKQPVDKDGDLFSGKVSRLLQFLKHRY